MTDAELAGTPEEQALADLARVADRLATSWFLIGAGARVILDGIRGVMTGRSTRDWDIAVRAESWAEFENLIHELTKEGSPFWQGDCAHRLNHQSGCWIDVLPFGGIEGPEGKVVWRSDGRVMSVVAFVECESAVTIHPLAPGLEIRVATIPAQVILKAHAYYDRSEHGITKDLKDLDHLLRYYGVAENEDRCFELAAVPLGDQNIDWEHAGAWLLGFDVGRTFPPKLTDTVSRLAHALRTPYSDGTSVLATARLGDDDEVARKLINERYSAFALGLDAGVEEYRRSAALEN